MEDQTVKIYTLEREHEYLLPLIDEIFNSAKTLLRSFCYQRPHPNWYRYQAGGSFVTFR